MALEVGTDTYITIAEANAYIQQYFVSTDTQRIAWEALSDDDKEVYLRNSLSHLENVQYTGRKEEYDQNLQFPRCYRDYVGVTDDYHDITKKPGINYDGFWACQEDVPEEVKKAQAFEGLELASPGNDTKQYQTYNGNVKGYSTIGLSETFNTGGNVALGTVQSQLRSIKAQQLIVQFTGGGFRVV